VTYVFSSFFPSFFPPFLETKRDATKRGASGMGTGMEERRRRLGKTYQDHALLIEESACSVEVFQPTNSWLIEAGLINS